MSTKGGRGFLLAASVLGSILIGAAPAFAQHGGGGGGHGGGGGGGHAGGGGGHAGGGGGHAGGGGGHMGGGGGHPAGGGHAPAGHFAPGGHFSPSVQGYRGYAGAGYAHGYPISYAHGYPAAYHGSYGHPGAYYGHGYSTGAYWHGGYWHGGFWPRCYYGVGFSWFLPVLPLAYATYWYAGVPYYYANDVYYTYNPSYEGYVATDPPPVTESAGAEGAAASVDGAQGGGPGPADQIFMYPKNGQSAEQQATDKAECQQWAAEQAGSVAQNSPDYRRAMTACVEGRGYSAR